MRRIWHCLWCNKSAAVVSIRNDGDFSSTRHCFKRNNCRVRVCIIFNPTAKGDKAKHFSRHLDEIGAECALKKTSNPGDARKLAAAAVREGFRSEERRVGKECRSRWSPY